MKAVKMQNKPKIIVFSGIDGSGKSTQLKLIYNELILNYKVFISKIEYMPLNDMNKNLIKNLLIEFKSGIEILKQATEIQTKDNKFDYILCDRYLMCYLAYAYIYGIEPIELIRKMLFFIKNPDLTLYFDIDVTLALDRIKERNSKINKHENYESLIRAKKGYEKLYNFFGNIEIIDANKSIEEINNNVKDTLIKRKLITHF